MFGINGGEFLVLAIVALVVVGPDKLPHYAAEAGRMIRQLRALARQAQDDVREHLGPEFADIDVRDLDPRRFVQRHLFDEGDLDDLRFSLDGDVPTARGSGDGRVREGTNRRRVDPAVQAGNDGPPPFDRDAT